MEAVADLFEPPVWPVLATALGLVLGSFANVCVHRLPRDESVISPPSHCPACNAPIRPWDNVPVLSWLVLRARCRDCRAPISLRYPAVEATNGALFLALGLVFGPSPRTAILMAFVTAMLVLALVDLDHQILPNALTRPGIVLGLLAAAATRYVPGLDEAHPGGVPWPGLREAALSAAGGWAAFALVALAGRWYYGEEALGQGDWKLAAMIGAFLGWRSLLATVFLGALAGSIVGLGLMAAGRGRRARIPLGTFLAAAAIAVVFLGPGLWGLYQRAFWGGV